MIWPGILGAVLGIVNAVWNIWRWRVDRTYVAWTMKVEDADWDGLAGRAHAVTVTNSGVATAYDVSVIGFESGEPVDSLGLRMQSLPHVYKEETVRVDASSIIRLVAIRITWRDRPGKKLRSGVYDPFTGESRTPNFRERLGARIAGNPIRR